MRVEKLKDKIIVYEPTDFNAKQTLDCGQIFRFKIDGDIATVNSKDKFAKLVTYLDRVEILTKDVEYFYNFFDFDTDYSKIKQRLKQDSYLVEAVDYGYGIRIIKNDLYEMIISYIISANNNIKRIQKSIEYLCVNFGTNMGEYFAFPTLSQLKMATEKDYTLAGLGYRAPQMYETVQRLTQQDLDDIPKMPYNKQKEFLISLKGVGEKVANCILLFGLYNMSSFPVDTWINKVYNAINNTNQTNRKLITSELTNRYGVLSGYAQQYFFYYFRDNKKG